MWLASTPAFLCQLIKIEMCFVIDVEGEGGYYNICGSNKKLRKRCSLALWFILRMWLFFMYYICFVNKHFAFSSEKKINTSSNFPTIHFKHPVKVFSNTCNVKHNIAASNWGHRLTLNNTLGVFFTYNAGKMRIFFTKKKNYFTITNIFYL